VPAIAEAVAKQKMNEVEEKAHLALKMTWLFGLPATVGLSIIAESANVMLFEDAAGSDVLAILAWTAIFSTLCMTSSGILQGVGKIVLPAVHLLIGAYAKWLLNLWWIPWLGLRGAAFATVAAFILVTLLNLWALRKEIPSVFSRFPWWRSLLAVGVMAGAVWAVNLILSLIVKGWLLDRLAYTLIALTSVLIGVLVYGWAMFRFGVLQEEDLEKVPKLKKKLEPILSKLRIHRT
jgi:PST family polysaccharide transporter